jgi:hypothetical protein
MPVNKIKNFIEPAFHNYVKSFYGAGGIYDIDATDAEIQTAIRIRLGTIIYGAIEYAGDTTDREIVRDIILNLKGGAKNGYY